MDKIMEMAPVLRTTGDNDSIITALTTAMTTVKTDFLTAMGSILPIALAIVGAGLVIVLGVKYFKSIAKK